MENNDVVSFDSTREVLAAFLAPNFGDIYGPVGKKWTPALKATVKKFLLSDLDAKPDVDFETVDFPLDLPDELQLIDADPATIRILQTEYFIEHYLPHEIAHACRRYMVMNMHSLREVLGKQIEINAWMSIEHECDIADWLVWHASYDEVVYLAGLVGASSEIPSKRPSLASTEMAQAIYDIGCEIAEVSSPSEVVQFWEEKVRHLDTAKS